VEREGREGEGKKGRGGEDKGMEGKNSAAPCQTSCRRLWTENGCFAFLSPALL